MWPWPLTFDLQTQLSSTSIVNMSAKFDEDTHNGSVFVVHTRLFPYIYNGIISPSLNPAKIFNSIFDKFVSTSSPRQLDKSHAQWFKRRRN